MMLRVILVLDAKGKNQQHGSEIYHFAADTGVVSRRIGRHRARALNISSQLQDKMLHINLLIVFSVSKPSPRTSRKQMS